jgi:hypothetical protein
MAHLWVRAPATKGWLCAWDGLVSITNSRFRIGVAVACAMAATSCSALVNPEGLVTRCEVRSGEEDPCQALGLSCQGGTCQPCDSENEICDGRDNDCDGDVDEGHDADDDGYTWCGGGRPELADCVPDDPDIHPSPRGPDGSGVVEERCDGLDNDCDGDIDEDPECGGTAQCGGDEDCADGLSCDALRDRCVAPRSEGSWCRSDAECSGGFCVSREALGLPVFVSSLCATACCNDADCADDGVCVQSGTGARVCLPREVAGRQSLQEGEGCFRSSQCASGVCQDGRCVATCGSDSDCAAGMCRLNVATSTLLEGAGAWICGPPAGRDQPGARCTAFDPIACESALCLNNRCLGPCGSDADCGEDQACRYVEVQGLLGGGRVTACIGREGEGDDRACCTNVDCEDGETCRPMEEGGSWGMFCR